MNESAGVIGTKHTHQKTRGVWQKQRMHSDGHTIEICIANSSHFLCVPASPGVMVCGWAGACVRLLSCPDSSDMTGLPHEQLWPRCARLSVSGNGTILLHNNAFWVNHSVIGLVYVCIGSLLQPHTPTSPISVIICSAVPCCHMERLITGQALLGAMHNHKLSLKSLLQFFKLCFSFYQKPATWINGNTHFGQDFRQISNCSFYWFVDWLSILWVQNQQRFICHDTQPYKWNSWILNEGYTQLESTQLHLLRSMYLKILYFLE